MCNLYSITTNQEAIRALFRVMNCYVGNLPAMPGVFPDYPAPVVRNAGAERELVLMRWGMPGSPVVSADRWRDHVWLSDIEPRFATCAERSCSSATQVAIS